MGRCLRTILHGVRFEFLCDKAIHQRSGVQPSLPYAVGINLKRLRHSVWTPRSSVPTESTGKHRGVATGIGTENSGALAMDCGPYLLAEHPYPDLNL
jgi:hypothetical protein